MKLYTDIDYDSFPPADLDLDLHWIQLPRAVILEQRKAREAALQAQRIAEQPTDHQIILIPADPDYSPKEEELWPVINHAVLKALKPHEAACHDVIKAAHQAIAAHRGWRNPYPVTFHYPERPITKRTQPN